MLGEEQTRDQALALENISTLMILRASEVVS